MEFQIYSLTEK